MKCCGLHHLLINQHIKYFLLSNMKPPSPLVSSAICDPLIAISLLNIYIPLINVPPLKSMHALLSHPTLPLPLINCKYSESCTTASQNISVR